MVKSFIIFLFIFSISSLSGCFEKKVSFLPEDVKNNSIADNDSVGNDNHSDFGSTKLEQNDLAHSTIYFLRHGVTTLNEIKNQHNTLEEMNQEQIGELLFNSILIDSVKEDFYSIKLFRANTGPSISDFDYENQTDDIYIVGESVQGEPVRYFIKRVGPIYGIIKETAKIEVNLLTLDISMENKYFTKELSFKVDLEKAFPQK